MGATISNKVKHVQAGDNKLNPKLDNAVTPSKN